MSQRWLRVLVGLAVVVMLASLLAAVLSGDPTFLTTAGAAGLSALLVLLALRAGGGQDTSRLAASRSVGVRRNALRVGLPLLIAGVVAVVHPWRVESITLFSVPALFVALWLLFIAAAYTPLLLRELRTPQDSPERREDRSPDAFE